MQGVSTPHDRLKWARKNAGYEEDASEAARALGVKESTYLGHENGSRGLSRAAARYARFFRVSLDWLLAGRGEPISAPPPRRAAKGAAGVVEIPLLSWVNAGALADPQTQIPVEDVPLLAFADLGRGDFFALKVQGDSMDRLSPDGSTIVINRADQALVAGKPYVFSIRGATTYKLWQPDDPPYLQPYSTNPSHRPIFVKRKRDLEVIGRVKRSLIDL
jgi:SOS-response transcriptional repressor LexA